MSEEKLTKIELKLRKRHPKKAFRIGRHVVTPIFSAFEMNEAELKELKTKGCKAWLISKEEASKKKTAKKKD